jgi:hypothetical protein
MIDRKLQSISFDLAEWNDELQNLNEASQSVSLGLSNLINRAVARINGNSQSDHDSTYPLQNQLGESSFKKDSDPKEQEK